MPESVLQQHVHARPASSARRTRPRTASRSALGTLPEATIPDATVPTATVPTAAVPIAVETLQPVTGIVDIRGDHGFVRMDGYLAGPDDVYLSPAQVHRHGLRSGDAITGATRQHSPTQRPATSPDSNRRAKPQPLMRLDTINGTAAGEVRRRPEFYHLTPLYPQRRIRLETGDVAGRGIAATESNLLTTRVIDLLMPIGKGQRALIVSPPKAGKTTVLQAIAHGIAVNHPECHLMALLVDERPEEVTDMRRSVNGEVIASTFDRPPSEHILVAELAIERAKRLVEVGRDVVVLLDSITRLGRAYNLAAPASGRVMSGGIDASALHGPKRFLGAARNIEDGGSLTIIATALVETGSVGDTLIFEEFKSTGNAELRLLRATADHRIFPAVDVDSSGTRKEELLLDPDELSLVRRLRKALHTVDQQHAVEQLLDRLRKTGSNAEFLLQLARTTPEGGQPNRR